MIATVIANLHLAPPMAAVDHPPAVGDLRLLAVPLILIVAALAFVEYRPGRRRARRHVDTDAAHLVTDRGVRRYTDTEAGPSAIRALGPGPQIGQIVGTGKMLHATWEDVVVEIAGARMGKTTSVVIPAVIDAPGAVYVTSNKRDVVDATRAIREQVGPVWVFDPQHLAGTAPTWWWNPLDTAGTVAGARALAGLFAAATRPPGSAIDAYFDPEGEELLALLLLAASTASRPLTDVYGWLSDPRDDQAVTILADTGHDLAARGVAGILAQPDRQRAGVYGTARKTLAFVADPALAAWVVDPEDGRPRLDAATFTDTRSTLYSLSKEGPGSAGPLTAALTAAILTAAETEASRSPHGRLPVPLVGVLDEVANVCRWRDLPDLYSHYGSRGIVLLSFLQSWSQGVECWGHEGIRKLWGAANVRVYGGGVNDADLLEDISQLCGDYDSPTTTTSHRAGQRTVTTSVRQQRVFDISALAALPQGRAIVMCSGTRPVLVRTQSCHHGPWAEQIHQSETIYGQTT